MIVRTLAIFVALLALAGAIARVLDLSFDPTILWIDLRAIPKPIGSLLLVAFAASLCAFACNVRHRSIAIAPSLFALLATANVFTFYTLLARGVIRTSLFVPFTLITALTCVVIAIQIYRKKTKSQGARTRTPKIARFIIAPACFGAYLGAFALLQMYCFGKTDYTRPADAIVVLGARAYADGRPSDALADRVRTAAALYHEGRASSLIMSGGPGDGAIDEPHAMRDYAVSLGVPADAIELDPSGINTAATIDYLAQNHRDKRILAVSHFYHLPRVKLIAEQRGLRLTTSPARERYTLTQLPYNIAREIAAYWVYLGKTAKA